jgi:GNAT superfamily N-acetyltransferase/predicted CoA-binding protein
MTTLETCETTPPSARAKLDGRIVRVRGVAQGVGAAIGRSLAGQVGGLGWPAGVARVAYFLFADGRFPIVDWVGARRQGRGVTVASGPEPRRLVRDVLLRDGWTLRLQTPMPVDYEDIKAFMTGSRRRAVTCVSTGLGVPMLSRADAEAGGVDRLVLLGRHDGRVVAVASYVGLREPGVVEVAFAVADDDQRRGIGMRMLEQLAEIAAGRGIHRFDAEVAAANRLMLGVFEHAGFAARRQGFGELTVSLDITPTEAVLERIDERDHFAAVASLRAILAPASVAVVGAAAAPGNVGRAVLENIIAGRFEGVVWPVNRAGGVVCSTRTARSLAELEVAPELVIIAAAGDEVLEFAAEAAASGARALVVLPAGPDRDVEALLAREERLLEIVRGGGLRLVGPSSLGVLNTAAEVSLNATFTGARVRAGVACAREVWRSARRRARSGSGCSGTRRRARIASAPVTQQPSPSSTGRYGEALSPTLGTLPGSRAAARVRDPSGPGVPAGVRRA